MTEKVTFHKMHGIGNDFALIDLRKYPINLTTAQIQHLATRHTGIGFDQLILINQSANKQCDASYKFYNPDGSQAEQCGNGQRCISLYLHQLNPKQSQFCVDGLAGKIKSQINLDKTVTVNMGSIKSCKSIQLSEKKAFEVNFGNPHLVTIVDDVLTSDLLKLQKHYCHNYKNGINFEIAQIIDKDTIKIRVHERGTGETLACGSGACAAFYALFNNHQLNNKAKVMLPGGNLVVEYDSKNDIIYLTGSATHVFTGEFNL